MSYALIDQAIDEWAAKHSLLMEKEFAGGEARFCYLSNTLGDTVQIYIAPLSSGEYSLVAELIESTDDDREVEIKLVAGASDIQQELEQILSSAKDILSL